MPSKADRMIPLAMIVCVVSSVGAAPQQSLPDLVRKNGNITQVVQSFHPPGLGLKDLAEHSSLTIEGVVSHVQTSLTADEVNIYTDVTIDVTRVFRMELQGEITAAPRLSSMPSPFVGDQDGMAGPGASTARIKLRLWHTGTIQLEGGTATQRAGYPDLEIGEHIITSASLDPFPKAPGSWVPVGIFHVRGDGHVVSTNRDYALHYESVEAFASALASAPRTVGR